MAYEYLGPRGPVKGLVDQTGANPGNWTIVFTPQLLFFNVPYALVHRISISGAPGSAFSIYIENNVWATNIYGTQNDWEDAGDNLTLLPGQTLYFMYNDPITDNNAPVATVYLRYPSEGR